MGRTRREKRDEYIGLIVTSMLTREISETDLWNLDVIGIKDEAEKQSKIEQGEGARQHFLKTLKRLPEGRRFIGRGGRPTIIYTDNGSNFAGSNQALNKVDWNKFKDDTSVSRIQWKFIPPSSPWWGGFCERLIGLLKTTLRKVLGKASLRLKLRKDLRKRFRTEYLGQLRSYVNRSRNRYTFCGGDIVLIESTAKRINWSLGKVVQLIEGKDGVVSLVKIRTKQGDLLRPIPRLYPLEVSSPNDGDLRKLIEGPTICEKSECNISSDPSSLVPDSGEELSPTPVPQRVSRHG
ncbi:hypothetical protein AVEN_5161-1 [Araneus ventricosus]|uniref:DUF5641 domain-containing protein n=1 Tax=Araneus ventricosus TaxID=182803 RepID=A0A4Y2HSN3_ARAVE|nr:hypothetical protein AVEN_5161-1 [Araneus ventricosus]